MVEKEVINNGEEEQELPKVPFSDIHNFFVIYSIIKINSKRKKVEV